MAALSQKLRDGGWMVVVGAMLVIGLVWLAGPYLAIAGQQPLLGIGARLLCLLLIAAAVTAVWLLRNWMLRRQSARLASALGDADNDVARRSAGERRKLESHFQEAMQLLRGRPGKKSLYALPWYAVIGPPGSGKTTLLQNSGLNFPLAGRFGKESLRGVGGTRHCDWWFTDEAVFLDTAGRYTTQDSDRAVDASGWKDFLHLLGKHRPRRPLNGVLVTMSLSDLLTLSPAERQQHAHAIRRRLDELNQQLHVQVPVYLVLTKCDLLAGFSEFFDDLSPPQRAQVWGASFALEKSLDASASLAFSDEFARLLDRLNARVLKRLHDERDGSRRAALLAFPLQFSAVGDVLREFVEGVFAGQAHATAPMLRGFYLTSGTQEGTPIDRMLGAVARSFGLDAQQAPEPTAHPRTFFIEQLLLSVVLRESGLAGFSPKRERRRRWLHAAGCVAVAGVTGVLVLALLGSYQGNRQYLADVQQALDRRPPSEDPSTASDLGSYYQRALHNLQTVDDVMEVARAPDTRPWSQGWGLYQRHAVQSQLEQAKARQTNALLVPAMSAQLRRGMQRSAAEPQALYYYLKGYLMLADSSHLNPAELRTLIGLDAQQLFQGDPVLLKALDRQLEGLAVGAGKLRVITPDPLLLEQARNSLRSANLATLVYSHLQLAVQSQSHPPLRLDRELGLLADVFSRRSGTALSEPLPALYTQPVFVELASNGIDQAVTQFVADDWVLGPQRIDAMARGRLANEVLALYEKDYIRAWEGLLADLQLAQGARSGDTSSQLAAVAGPSSPLRMLLSMVAGQTQDMMRAAPDSSGGQAAAALAEKAEAAAAKAVAGTASSLPSGLALQAALGPASAGGASPTPGASVGEHFSALAQLTAGDAGATPLDQVLLTFQRLSQGLLSSTAGAPGEVLLQARQQAAQLPAPVSGWLLHLTGQSTALINRQAQAQVDGQVAQAVGKVCRDFVLNRYPFDPAAEAEIPVQNFAELFGHQGHFDTLYQQTLSGLLDVTGPRWKWKDKDNAGSSDGGLPLRMQSAEAIKQRYFRGGNQPEVGFTLLAPTLGEGVARLDVHIDGQRYDYQQGAPPSMPMKWPGPIPGRVSLTAFDAAGERLGGVVHLGDWAFFRALQKAGLKADSDLRYTATFDFDGHVAQLPLQAANLRHPFMDGELATFGCGS